MERMKEWCEKTVASLFLCFSAFFFPLFWPFTGRLSYMLGVMLGADSWLPSLRSGVWHDSHYQNRESTKPNFPLSSSFLLFLPFFFLLILFFSLFIFGSRLPTVDGSQSHAPIGSHLRADSHDSQIGSLPRLGNWQSLTACKCVTVPLYIPTFHLLIYQRNSIDFHLGAV